METDHLYYFKRVAELGSLTQAARELSLTPSTLSRLIQRLENDLGVPLFNHAGHSLTLNDNGHLLLRRVNQILPLINQTRRDLLDTGSGTQSVSINMLNGNGIFPELLTAFQEKYPSIRIDISRFDHGDIVNTDCEIFIHDSDKTARTLPSRRLFTEECYIGVSRQHHFAEMAEVPFRSLAAEPFIVLNEENPLGRLTRNFFKKTAINPRIIMTCDNQVLVSSFVALNMGIAFFPSLTWQTENAPIVIKPVSGYPMVRTLYITTPTRKCSPAAETFRNFALSYLKHLNHLPTRHAR
ncbi:MAG: LysR family transcriptional regulator [Lachnospiraceae bacterium]|nr:LysR family transcriptional regulator [Lachnospiraceae bacterium]